MNIQNENPQPPVNQNPAEQPHLTPEEIDLINNDPAFLRIQRAILVDPNLRNEVEEKITASYRFRTSIFIARFLVFVGFEVFCFVYGIKKQIFPLINFGVCVGFNFCYQMINGLYLEQCCSKEKAKILKITLGIIGGVIAFIFLMINLTTYNDIQTNEDKFMSLFSSGISSTSGGILIAWMLAPFMVNQIKKYLRNRQFNNNPNN